MNSFGQEWWDFYATFISIAWALAGLPPRIWRVRVGGRSLRSRSLEQLTELTRTREKHKSAAWLKSDPSEQGNFHTVELITSDCLTLHFHCFYSVDSVWGPRFTEQAEKWLEWHDTESLICCSCVKQMFFLMDNLCRLENPASFRNAAQRAITYADQDNWSQLNCNLCYKYGLESLKLC